MIFIYYDRTVSRQEAKGRDSGMGSGKVWELALVLGTSWSASTLSAHCLWGCQCQHKRSLRYSNVAFITHMNEHCVVDFYWLLSVIINCRWAAKIVQNVGSTGLCRWPTTKRSTTEGPCHIPLCVAPAVACSHLQKCQGFDVGHQYYHWKWTL